MHHITPIITKQNGKKSLGKGFSPTELSKAGLTKQDARKIGLRIDVKRKSAHDENIATLKAHAQDAKAQPKPKAPAATPAETEKPKKKAKS
jgi:ribosomal protein L13E